MAVSWISYRFILKGTDHKTRGSERSDIYMLDESVLHA
jgi:hypothetical protein